MKKKLKRSLTLMLALCLVMTYMPLQASAEDGTRKITSAEDWATFFNEVTPETWPQEIVINAEGEEITVNGYVWSKVTIQAGTFISNFGVDRAVTVEGGKFVHSADTNGPNIVTVSGGEFENNGSVTHLTMTGGTFTNKKKVYNAEISGGTFANKGVVNNIDLSSGILQVGSNTNGTITITGGSIANISNAALTLIVNGKQFGIGLQATANAVLADPQAKFEVNDDNTQVTGSWTPVDGATAEVKLYKYNQVVATATYDNGENSVDFTNEILENGYGNYSLTVQLTNDDSIPSVVSNSGVFKYERPSYGDVTKDGYTWEPFTGTLTLKTNDACSAWKEDTDILGTLISDKSFQAVKHVILGPAVDSVGDGSFAGCSKVEDVIIQSSGKLGTGTYDWDDIPNSAVAYDYSADAPGFPGTTKAFECLIVGIEDGEVFRGRAPYSFRIYGVGTRNATENIYMQPLSWEIKNTSGDRISGENITEDAVNNAYTVDNLNLTYENIGSYTLTVTYQPMKLSGSSWEDDGQRKTTSVNFSIVSESEGDPGQYYPPAVTSYVITSSAEEGGVIAPEGTTRVDGGQDASYTVKADEGYVIKDVLVDDVSVGTIETYTFEKVSADHTIHAIFEKTEKPVEPDDPDHPEKPEKPTSPGKPDALPTGKETGGNKDQPKTGDENQLLLWIFLAGTAGVTSMAVRRRKIKSR